MDTHMTNLAAPANGLPILNGTVANYFVQGGNRRIRFTVPTIVVDTFPKGQQFRIERDGSHDFFLHFSDRGARFRQDKHGAPDYWIIDITERKPFTLSKDLPEFGASPSEVLYDATTGKVLIRVDPKQLRAVIRRPGRTRAKTVLPTPAQAMALKERLRMLLQQLRDIEAETGYRIDRHLGELVFNAPRIEL